MDVEIAMDMSSTVDQYDIAILVSGDADFHNLLKDLKAKGKKIIVISTSKNIK